MHASGSGFMAFFTRVDEDVEAEYLAFLSREHMPERLSLPGFQRVRLLRSAVGSDGGSRPYMALYETASLGVLTSPEYLNRLANPTRWTSNFMPKLHGSVRGAGRSVFSSGSCGGGAVAVSRWSGTVDMPDSSDELSAVAQRPFVTAVHVLEIDAASTDVRTPGTAREGNPVRFGTLIVCEATIPAAAEDAVAKCERALDITATEDAAVFRHAYELALSLDRRDVEPDAL